MCYGTPVLDRAVILPMSQIRIAHGNDALCCDSLLGTKIAQT